MLAIVQSMKDTISIEQDECNSNVVYVSYILYRVRIINPRHACARVTVVVLCVCLCIRLFPL